MPENLRQEEEANTRRRARILSLDYVDTSAISDKPLFRYYLSNQEMHDMKVVPIRGDKYNVIFGITNNTSQLNLRNLRQRFLDQRVSFALISDSGYREYMKLYDPDKKVVYRDIDINETKGQEESVKNVSLTLEQVRATDMLAYIVEQAHMLGASDIHIETQQDDIKIRFRIDGVLHQVAKVDKDKYRVLVGAIASAGNISTNEDEAQQGHIYQHVKMANGDEVDINIRLETTPTINGMDIVMRIFNMDTAMFSLEKLGLSKNERKIIDDIITKPTGLVLLVGPTGSGKTTTLYTIINSLKNDERKIITIEDPVEYQFPGITQISIASKSGEQINETKFAAKLRAVLRLDPDIVMVGEIRDDDTAKTALQASLTGHLVLSTFHADSVAATLTRLIDIIGQNTLFLSSIRLIMAQRLVRKLDDKTKQPYQPNAKTLSVIEKLVSNLPDTEEKPNLENLQIFRAGGSVDNPFGYAGRLAIREEFVLNEKIMPLIQGEKIPSTHEIEAAMVKGGMMTLAQDAILKVIAGQTSLEEVYRVIDLG